MTAPITPPEGAVAFAAQSSEGEISPFGWLDIRRFDTWQRMTELRDGWTYVFAFLPATMTVTQANRTGQSPADRVAAALEASGWLNCDPEDWEAVKAQLPPDGAVAWLRLPNLDVGQRMTLMAYGEEFEIVRPGELAELKIDAERLEWMIGEGAACCDRGHGNGFVCRYGDACHSSYGATARQAIDRARGVK